MTSNREIATSIPCVIIDDDPFIRDLLMDKLNQNFPEMKVIGTAENGKEGIRILNGANPQLVFLDVEMNDMTGFEMLGKLTQINFKTIFITSYRHYAIKAIRFNALDYLLKPIDLEELRNAISRFKSQSSSNEFQESIQQALVNFSNPNPKDQILSLNTQDGLLRIPLKDIVHIQGDRNYSSIFLIKGKKHVVSKTLSDLEEILADKNFFRCHKSHLVNKIHIHSQPNSFSILMTSGLVLPISRRRKEEFQDWFQEN